MTNDSFIYAVKRNSRRLYLIALSFTKSHYDAEDIIQNAFMKLWNCKNEFNSQEHMDKWLTTVCINESRNYIKHPFRKCTSLDDAAELYCFDTIAEIVIQSDTFSEPTTQQSK